MIHPKATGSGRGNKSNNDFKQASQKVVIRSVRNRSLLISGLLLSSPETFLTYKHSFYFFNRAVMSERPQNICNTAIYAHLRNLQRWTKSKNQPYWKTDFFAPAPTTSAPPITTAQTTRASWTQPAPCMHCGARLFVHMNQALCVCPLPNHTDAEHFFASLVRLGHCDADNV